MRLYFCIIAWLAYQIHAFKLPRGRLINLHSSEGGKSQVSKENMLSDDCGCGTPIAVAPPGGWEPLCDLGPLVKDELGLFSLDI